MYANDKFVFKALKFFANNTRKEIETIIEQDKDKNTTTYREDVSEDTEAYLSDADYIQTEGNSKWIITEDGQKLLRELGQIRHRDITLYLSIAAIIISVFTLGKVMGWWS